MKALASKAAVAFAIANLYLLYLTGPLVSPQHQLIFHLPGAATPLFAAAIVDVLALTILLTLLLFWTQAHPRCRLLLWTVLVLPLPAVLLATVATFSGRPANVWLLGAFLFLPAAAFSFTLARLGALVPLFRRSEAKLTTSFTLISCAGLLLFSQLLWNGWVTRHLNPPFIARAPASLGIGTRQKPQPRVVWVILDELSYRQIFTNRQPGLTLPNFDRLAGVSTVLTHTQAAAEYTRIAVPSLLTGLPLTATVPTADGRQLLLHVRDTPGWQPLQPGNTVFADVARTGLPTGIAGWYEPYCRLLPRVLNTCSWTYRDDLPEGLSATASFAANALAPVRTAAKAVRLLGDLVQPAPQPDEAGQLDVERHAADYRDLYAAGDLLLQKQSTGLLLLHMPIPHPWGFYDRRTASFPPHRTSYLDNLVLADLYVGHIRRLMEADGTWDRTTLILMGDHGWRTHDVWRPSGFWTREEEQASHGGTLADRPAVFIKLPGQQLPARLDATFAAYRTRTLIDDVVAGKLHTPDDLRRWIGSAPR